MSNREVIYVGTYTQPILFGTGQILEGKGKGIYRYELDTETGAIEFRDETPGVLNPSYLTVSPDHRFLYAVNELKEFEGKKSGAVSAFKINPETLGLTFLNQKATFGTDPCHVAVGPGDKHIYVANFMSGSECVFPVNEDGSLSDASCFVQHEGHSVDPKRQLGPHAHSTSFSPDGRFAFVPDLGKDMLLTYEIDEDAGTIRQTAAFKTEPAAGPRHCIFHPNGRYCYLTNEMDCTIYVLLYHEEDGTFEKLQSVPLLEDDSFEGHNSGADIQITPDGRFLYGSNRGHNSLIGYAADPETGLLTYISMTDGHGGVPRCFAIDPTGKFVIIANQDDDNLVVFRIQEDGTLVYVTECYAPTPVCVKPYLF